MQPSRHLLSVGIDIGTTTTQVIFSDLAIEDVSRLGQIPRISITERKVLYQSEVVFTPLLDAETIDVVRLKQFLDRVYSEAGVLTSQIETGAVIITGETAKKQNADEILKAVAGLAGDFVVTVAGPNVESMISGRGSGAARYSQEHFTTVTNVDIGGGSSNSALFRQGKLVATAAMNYGGRIMEIDRASGQIRHITVPGRILLEQLGLKLQPGDRPALTDLARVCDLMAGLTLELIEGGRSPLAAQLYLTPPSPVSGRGKQLMISGGIGHYYYDPVPVNSLEEITIHADLGPLLAARLRANPELQSYASVRPPETIRATVLGASSQLVTLSGSTIWAEKGILPLRNVPVVRPYLEPSMPPDRMAEEMLLAARRWDINLHADPFSICLPIDQTLNYSMLQQIAQGLQSFAAHLPADRPLIVIIGRDYAQVLGQTLKALIAARPLLVIDQVGLEEGDYIDIGAPLLDGRVVPLSVKTLIFYHA